MKIALCISICLFFFLFSIYTGELREWSYNYEREYIGEFLFREKTHSSNYKLTNDDFACVDAGLRFSMPEVCNFKCYCVEFAIKIKWKKPSCDSDL